MYDVDVKIYEDEIDNCFFFIYNEFMWLIIISLSFFSWIDAFLSEIYHYGTKNWIVEICYMINWSVCSNLLNWWHIITNQLHLKHIVEFLSHYIYTKEFFILLQIVKIWTERIKIATIALQQVLNIFTTTWQLHTNWIKNPLVKTIS